MSAVDNTIIETSAVAIGVSPSNVAIVSLTPASSQILFRGKLTVHLITASNDRRLAGTVSGTVTYTVLVPGFESTVEAQGYVQLNLQSSISSGLYSAYLQSYAVANGAAVLYTATSSTPAEVQQLSSPSAAPNAAPKTPTITDDGGLTSSGEIAIAVVFSLVGIAAFAAAYYYYRYYWTKKSATELRNSLLNP